MDTITQSTIMAKPPGRPKSDKPRKTTMQVPLDDPDAKAVRAHAKAYSLTIAEALRQLVRAGLANNRKGKQ